MNCADTLCGFYTNFNETPCRWSAVALICQDSRESRRQARIDDLGQGWPRWGWPLGDGQTQTK